MRLPRLRRQSDAALLAATAQDGEAFGVFYDRYERTVLAYMRRRVRSPELAADLTAEVFAAALEGAASFTGREGAAPAAWLFGIAKHVLAGSYRRAQVDADARARLGIPRLALTDEVLEHLDRVIGRRDGARAIAGLERLPVDQREAIRARIVEDRTYDDIAQQLQCSTAVIRQRVSRGLATLRNEVPQP